jgi:hypothetical protein
MVMTNRHTYRVQPFLPDDAPKRLSIWAEDYLLTIEPSTEKQGYQIQGRSVTVWHDPALPVAIFHRLMAQVVDNISHSIGLEAEYQAPPADRLLNPQPYNSLGWQ